MLLFLLALPRVLGGGLGGIQDRTPFSICVWASQTAFRHSLGAFAALDDLSRLRAAFGVVGLDGHL